LALWRNQWLTLSAVSVMTITLFVISTLFILNSLAGLSAENLQGRVDISVFFNQDVSQEQLESVKQEFEAFPEVASTRIITAEEALERFRDRHIDDLLVQATLEELNENPLQPSLVLTAHELDQYPVLFQQLQRSRFEPLIDTINYEDNRGLIETLDRITTRIRTFGIVLTAVFGFVAVLVMFNTLRLTIFSRREEIEIMRLVGASQAYITGPFVIEGVFYGIIATIIASAIFYPALSTAAPAIERFFGLNFSEGESLLSHFWLIALYMLLIGILLGVISSVIATRKYLKE
jgi:cell division transport system permease protein